MAYENVIILGVFAFVAFALKMAILFQIQIRSRIAECFTVLCLFFITQNVAEFLGYVVYFESESLGQFFVHIYMIALYFAFSSISILALALTESKLVNKARIVLYSASAVIALGHTTGAVVSGFEFIGWSVITKPGELYWFAMGFVGLNAIGTVVYLLFNYFSNPEFEIRKRVKVNLLAFTPLVAVMVGVLSLRAMGFNSTSAVSLPLATTAFLFVLLLHTNGNLFWLSLKFKILMAVLKMKPSNSLDEILEKVETVRIVEALKETNGKQVEAAKLLSVPPSTLCKKITKYNIEAKSLRRPRPTKVNWAALRVSS